MDSFFNFEPYQNHLIPESKRDREEDDRLNTKYGGAISTLPRAAAKLDDLYNYQGFWFPEWLCKGVMSAQDHFKALDTDILLASFPKSGTTWLQALIVAVVHRRAYANADKQHEHPLLHHNPHDLVLSLEMDLYSRNQLYEFDENFPQPRLFSTHLAYTSLPESVKKSSCRIVYICRNFKDTVVSYWHFLNKISYWSQNESSSTTSAAVQLEDYFGDYVKGFVPWGPHWDQVLTYWSESVRNPEKVLFLKYEELHEEPIHRLTKLANFLGLPFSEEERKNGVPEEILELCSLENLTSLEVNKKGLVVVHRKGTTSGNLQIPNTSFFRKGKVNDSENYLTDEMIAHLDAISQEKLQGSGLAL